MTRKTRANRKASTSSEPSFESDKFLSVKNQELYEMLNIKRKIWVERKVLLDELDPTIRAILSVGVGCHCWILIIHP